MKQFIRRVKSLKQNNPDAFGHKSRIFSNIFQKR